ncbi:MAG: hypothetical protein Q3996_00455 [Candidatus Saccharibacteria bacterium]|nr:hypothetical protein [Candidatus Saccharibacteria bacterium]
MIFQGKKEEPAQAQPIVSATNDQDSQDEQELAKVLADIDAQVGINNEELATVASTEQTDAASLEKQATESVVNDTQEASDSSKAIDFQRVAQEVADDQSASDFQASESEPTVVETKTNPVDDETQNVLNELNSQISNEMNNFNNANQPLSASLASEDSIVTESADNKPNYDDLKQQALRDLRPILDKIQLNEEESFDILLLMIRETDDESLLDKAYEAARRITDETRRAQALLDVIKEAEYFKHKN